MKITNKLHRGAAIAAGVLLLIAMAISIISAVTTLVNLLKYSSEGSYIVTSMLNSAMAIVILLLTAVMMLRCKKDTAAGVVFILIALYTLIRSVGGSVSSIFTFLKMGVGDGAFTGYLVLNLLANLVNFLFYILVALECFKPGCLSGSGAKIILILAPILKLLLSIVAYLCNLLASSQTLSDTLIVFMTVSISMILTGLGPIVAGIAFSIPVKEAVPVWSDPNSLN